MATKSIAWNTGTGNITLTYKGQGDGPISIQSDENNGSARSQVITVKTVDGAITKNLTIIQAACPFPVGDVRNFSYTGNYQEVELLAGQYKLQCWGAQGGSNAAVSDYGISAQVGGKGGYSEGIITLTQKTTVRVYVGGAGSSSAGGFNGGGSTTGSSTYNASDEQGVSRMGGGGGATDIRLNDASLLSRMIVAGGGSGSAMCYKSKTTSTTSWQPYATGGQMFTGWTGRYWYSRSAQVTTLVTGNKYRIKASYTLTPTTNVTYLYLHYKGSTASDKADLISNDTWFTFTFPSGYESVSVRIDSTDKQPPPFTFTIEEETTTTSTSTYNESQVGGVGGGTQGGGYSTSYVGKQNAAGSGGSFGQGANQTVSNSRYCSGAGGGGWYGGGGGQASNDDITACKNSGGGSGFVNTAASASNRPSGYTGLELDSGSTVDGEQTFEAPAGGTETGHSGNGYARITRLN